MHNSCVHKLQSLVKLLSRIKYRNVQNLTIVNIHIYRNHDNFIYTSCFDPQSYNKNSSSISGTLHSRMPLGNIPPSSDHLGLGEMPMFIL